jgi:hypothetical protein
MRAAVKEASQYLTIVTHGPGRAEVPWIRFLLGEWAGEVVEDPGRRLVVPYSLLVCPRPGSLRSKVLAEVRRLGSVGLLHVDDRRYRSRLDVYSSFGFVWRTYYHSALADLSVRQLPLGPAALDEVAADPLPAARRRPAERLYTWSFVDRHEPGHDPVLAAFRQVEGGYEQIGDGQAGTGGPAAEHLPVPRDRAAYLETLADSVFVACPMAGQHIETRRVYDALEMGAIPVVERRRRFDYFAALLGDHPLPTVRAWSEAPDLVRALLSDHTGLASLHERVVSWWAATKRSLARAAQLDVARCVSGTQVGNPLGDGPLNKPAPRWRGRVEVLRHHGPRAVRTRR